MITVPSLYPIRYHDRHCPFNVWLYSGRLFPCPLEIQYWDSTYGTKRKDQSEWWSHKQEECKDQSDSPARKYKNQTSVPTDCKVSKLSCFSWSRSTVSRSSSHSSLSSCYTNIRLPVDPSAPHAFTVNKTERHTNKTQQEIKQVSKNVLCVLCSLPAKYK